MSPDFHLLLEVIRLGIEIDVGDTEIRQFAYTFNAAVGGFYNAETVDHLVWHIAFLLGAVPDVVGVVIFGALDDERFEFRWQIACSQVAYDLGYVVADQRAKWPHLVARLPEIAAQDASVERLPCLRGQRKEQPRCVRPAPALRR